MMFFYYLSEFIAVFRGIGEVWSTTVGLNHVDCVEKGELDRNDWAEDFHLLFDDLVETVI